MTGYKKVATFVVLRCENMLLLLKRNKAPHINKFVPVGGKIEPYETPMESAKRETYEETGLQLEHLKYFGTLTETSPTDYNWVSFVYAANIQMIEVPQCSEGILSWIDYKDLNNIPSPITDLYIYKSIKENKKFAFNAIYNESLELISIVDDLKDSVIYTKKDT